MAVVNSKAFCALGPGQMQCQEARSWRKKETVLEMSYDSSMFLLQQSLEVFENYLSLGPPYSIIFLLVLSECQEKIIQSYYLFSKKVEIKASCLYLNHTRVLPLQSFSELTSVHTDANLTLLQQNLPCLPYVKQPSGI